MKEYYEVKRDNDNIIVCDVRNTPFDKEHYHSKIEIYYALTSGVKFKLNRFEYDMPKDSLIIADSFDVHSSTGNGKYAVLIIPDLYFDNYKAIKGVRSLKRKFFTDEKETKKLYSIIEQIFELYNGKDFNFLEMQGLVSYLLGTILAFSGFDEEKTSTGSDTLKEVLIFINNNFKKDLTLDKVSLGLGLNKHYLSHLISKSLNTSFNDYLNGLRISYFANNIDSSENMAKVASDSGFQSTATFYRAFDKVFGCSPKKFIDNKNKQKDGKTNG